MKKVGSAWQNRTPAEEEYFNKKAETDKVRYLDEMAKFYDEVERIGHEFGSYRQINGAQNE